jgi:hypothetical protein
MHVMAKSNPRLSAVRNALFPVPIGDVKDLSMYSSANLLSPFEHARFDAGCHGKIMLFKKNGNLIRAGKRTHGDAFLSALLFLRWMSPGRWLTAASAPNMVLSGKLQESRVAYLSAHHSVTGSSRFPGLALKLNVHSTCTPEIYPTSGRFILPGVSRVDTLMDTLDDMMDVLQPCVTEPSNISEPSP